MMEIFRIDNYEKVHRYVVVSSLSTHIEFMDFLGELGGFSNDEIFKFDVIFTAMDGAYMFLENKDTKIHVIFESNVFNLIIDSPLETAALNKKLMKHFTFPK